LPVAIAKAIAFLDRICLKGGKQQQRYKEKLPTPPFTGTIQVQLI
jgi:hypothetical protein